MNDPEFLLRQQPVPMDQALARRALDDARVAWATVRASLETQHFSDIKTIVGLAGLDLVPLGHLQQKQGGGATKGQLLSAIDTEVGKLDTAALRRFLALVAEELLERRPDFQGQLADRLARHGWALVDRRLIPLELFDPVELAAVPDAPRTDLVKAAQRFRDGDLSGAIGAACGAVDGAVALVYARHQLGGPARSFQEGCKRALEAVVHLDPPLNELGWDGEDRKQFIGSFNGALSHGAFVMQMLRTRMGDAHGTKPILKTLVFDALKWAELFVRTLTVQ
ncbi:hypothetical protein ACI2UY_22625 [Ralstonia nicotianae]